MKRREFITLLGGSAAAWPLRARAQQPGIPVIGYVSSEARESDSFRLPAFFQGLSETGFVERQNVTVEYRWADHQPDRLPELLADLVRRHCHSGQRSCCTHREGNDHEHSDRLRDRQRSGPGWTCDFPKPARRQYHRRDHLECGNRSETA
jgi:hypothetical protein